MGPRSRPRPARDVVLHQQRRDTRRASIAEPKGTRIITAGFAVPLGVSVLESAASGSAKRRAEEPLSDSSKRVKLTSPLQPQNALSIPEAQQPPSPTIDDFTKFTWATGLYAELQRQFRARSTKKMFRFRATHSIIADPKVNKKRRARQVERDLQQQTELQFDLDGRVKHRDEDAYTITHRCTCLPRCTGVIVIHVADDNSHPLGLPGQRVKLTVVHPKRAKLIPSILPPT
uniref:Uncharacterized protein n=1 Tax=Mycena chlorophos TaxID=658473 RepID=A0ABQ0M862_MYCCL|nr:predicted protein [Mycena chlorophos]